MQKLNDLLSNQLCVVSGNNASGKVNKSFELYKQMRVYVYGKEKAGIRIT